MVFSKFSTFLAEHKKWKKTEKFNFLLVGCTLFPGSQVFYQAL